MSKFLSEILNSQFLEGGYEGFGAFLPHVSTTGYGIEEQNTQIFFEHSYFAIKTLELLVDYLNMGNITSLAFDINALCTYINNNVEGGPTTLYFNPQYTDDTETILQNTYYMVYTLMALGRFNYDINKIKNYVLQTIDYSNIKNVYYCYKINNQLNLGIDFDVNLSHNLVQNIYDSEHNEYYVTSNREYIDQKVLYWICDMAKNDNVRIFPQLTPSVIIGTSNNLTATVCNLVVENLGPYMTVKYESDQIGTFTMNAQPDDTFQKDIFVPVSPNNYPMINGYIRVYDAGQLKGELNVPFQTSYTLNVLGDHQVNLNSVSISITVSINTGTGMQPIYGSNVFAEVFKDNQSIGTVNFARQDYLEFSIFSLSYGFEGNAKYGLQVFLNDTYESSPYEVYMVSGQGEGDIDDTHNTGEVPDQSFVGEIQISYPMAIIFIAIPVGVVIYSNKFKNKSSVLKALE